MSLKTWFFFVLLIIPFVTGSHVARQQDHSSIHIAAKPAPATTEFLCLPHNPTFRCLT